MKKINVKFDFNNNTTIRWIRIVAVVLAIVGLGFGYWAKQSMAQSIEKETTKYVTQNKELKTQEDQLMDLYSNKDFYEEKKAAYDKETEALLSQFPTYMYIEDKILYADTLQKEDLNKYNLTDIGYGESEFIMNTTYGDDHPLELYKVTLSAKFDNLSYLNLRTLMDYGLNSEQRFVVQSVQASFSPTTGFLTGQIVFSTYFIPGQTEPYEFPQTVINDLGQFRRTDDLFGTFSTKDTN